MQQDKENMEVQHEKEDQSVALQGHCWISPIVQLRDLDHKLKKCRKESMPVTPECWEWQPTHHGKRKQPMKFSIKTYSHFPKQEMKEEWNWQATAKDTLLRWHTTLSSGNQLMGKEIEIDNQSPTSTAWRKTLVSQHRRNKDWNDGKKWMEEVCQVRLSWHST